MVKANQKRAVVTGAGGFIGHHLVSFLKTKGFWVRGVDIKNPVFEPNVADEYLVADLREPSNCRRATEGMEEVYDLAADMGGMGFISKAECEVLRNNALINIHMAHTAAEMGILRYFFSSSVCVYRDMQRGEPTLTEDDAIPANPDNEYGWEKVRIARFENSYGPEGTWNGGREKAPAAICRKVAEAEDGGTIEVWGNGTAVRNYTYVDDLVAGIYLLMQSDLEGPANIGGDEYVTVSELVDTVIEVSGKRIRKKHVEGPVGVQSRNFDKARIKSLGWEAKISLREGIARTYSWIEGQVGKAVEEGRRTEQTSKRTRHKQGRQSAA